MGIIKLDDIKDQIEDLVSRAEAGETILIEKDGRTVARITGTDLSPTDDRKRQKIDIAEMQAFTRSLPPAQESGTELIRRMRDEGY